MLDVSPIQAKEFLQKVSSGSRILFVKAKKLTMILQNDLRERQV